MNSSYENSSSDEDEDRRRSSEEEEEDEEDESSSDSDEEDEDEEDEEDDSDDSTSSEELKRKLKKKDDGRPRKSTGDSLKKVNDDRLVSSGPPDMNVRSPRLSGGGNGGVTSGNTKRPLTADSTAVLVRGLRTGTMTEEEREREIERDRQKAQRKEERKKAIKNLDTIITSLQELEDLPHVDPNGRRESGPRSGGASYDTHERFYHQSTGSARNINSSHQESFSSASTGREEGETKERSGSRSERERTDSAATANGKESSGKEKGKEKEKEKEREKKSGGLVRLSIFHKRPHKEKEKEKEKEKTIKQPKKADAKKKPQKTDEAEQQPQQEGEVNDENGYVKVERTSKKKDLKFNKMYRVQTLGEQEGGHYGAIWVMQFSPDGRYLATAGSDGALRVWRVDPKLARDEGKQGRLSQYLDPVCFKTFPGHTLDILCISWSNNEFLLSSSMDCTVRLWHLSCDDCVSCFEHKDFVTTVAFHPINNKVFMSGGLDKRIYVWNIPRKRIAFQVDIGDMITAGAFVSEKGEYLAVGTDSGKLLFCETEEAITKEPTAPEAAGEGSATPRATIEMKVARELHVHNSRFKGRDHTRRKVTGIETSKDGKYMLVSSNDSAARLYRTKDFSLICKYSGFHSREFQVKATLSQDGKYVISGSEDPYVFLWEVGKEKRNKACEYFQVASDDESMATAAAFAPPIEGVHGQIIVAASLDGALHVYHNEQAEES